MRWFGGVGVAALLLLAASGARGQLVTDCAQLRIRLAGIPEVAGARCSGDENGWSETVDASGPGTIFVLHHAAAIGNTYYWRLSAGEIVDRLTQAAQVENRGEEFEVGDFDVMRYRVVPAEGAAPAACFAFVAYAGHIARTTGYRHSVVGYHCDLAGNEATDDRIDALLGAIEADFW